MTNYEPEKLEEIIRECNIVVLVYHVLGIFNAYYLVRGIIEGLALSIILGLVLTVYFANSCAQRQELRARCIKLLGPKT